jgi:hypothetical protein
MSRRIANYWFLITKLRAGLPENIPDALNPLAELLETNMVPAANRRFGGQAGVTAEQTANDAGVIGAIFARKCQMWYDAPGGEQNLLSEAYRRHQRIRGRLQAQVPSETAVRANTSIEPPPPRTEKDLRFDGPAWHIGLLDLLCLTSRPWAYIRLDSARQGTWGMLSKTIWPGSNQCTLTRQANRLNMLGVELAQAEYARRSARTPSPVESFLDSLDKAALADPLAPGVCEARREWITHVIAALPNPFPPSGVYPETAAALTRLRALLGFPGQAAVAGAWVELCRQTNTPSVLTPSDPPPADLLDVLVAVGSPPGTHIQERQPDTVLHDILRAPPSPLLTALVEAVTPSPADLVRPLLIQHLWNSTTPGSPESCVLGLLITAMPENVPEDHRKDFFLYLRERLRNELPRPAASGAGLLDRAWERLDWWHLHLNAVQPLANPWETMDLAPGARSGTAVDGARTLVQGWQAAGPQPPNGVGLSPAIELAVLSGILSACLDHLVEQMHVFFNKRQQPHLPDPPGEPAR